MRTKFLKMLSQLNESLSDMGALIETAIANAVQILKSGDISLLLISNGYEDEINAKEKDIENLCLKIILHEQPVADDLRLVSSALKIITDMDRIGDNALDIANISKKLYEKEADFEPNGIKPIINNTLMKMAEKSIKMVGDSVSAYVIMDMETVKRVIESDDIVDDLFDKYINELSERFTQSQKNSIPQIELLLIAKYFEKISDHAVNIAEWTEFAMTGEHKKHQ